MREYIDGEFIYIDSDTLVRDDISPIFTTNASLAGVPNHNGTLLKIPKAEMQFFEHLNWSLPISYYANGGVLFFSDTIEVHNFSDLWHKKWLESSIRIGKHNDQPSLNSAIYDSQVDFTYLENRFNAQVHARPYTAWGASIWHIYLSDPYSSPKTALNSALDYLRENHSISVTKIDKICQSSHPWIVNNIIDWLAVQSLKSNSEILNKNRWERLWLSEEYLKALKQFFYQYYKIIRNRIKRHKFTFT